MYHARVERALPDLYSQLDQMNAALREWREAQQQLEPLEARLRALTDRSAEVLDRWAEVDDRHVQAIADVEARLREFREVELRLQHEALERLRAFERTIRQEWSSSRDHYEEPLRQVREQALALAETCRATADLSLRSYERTEARLAALETDLRADVAALTREVRGALELVRGGQALPAPAAPFPLDSVMKIHEELRDAERAGTEPAHAPAPDPEPDLRPVKVLGPVPVPKPVKTAGSSSLFDTASDAASHATPPAGAFFQTERGRLVALSAALVLAVGAAGYWFQSHVTGRIDEAVGRAQAAERAAAASETQLSAARAEVERQSAAAEDAVARATLLGDVLAAPDLWRFALVGANEGEGASGQVVWSRSRGLGVSVIGLRPPAAGSVYRVWLLSTDRATAAGTLVPDASGRATLVTPNPANLPRPINSLQVTVESAAGTADAPTGVVVLARPSQP